MLKEIIQIPSDDPKLGLILILYIENIATINIQYFLKNIFVSALKLLLAEERNKRPLIFS